MSFINNLFINGIVSEDILKKHKTVMMQFDGPEEELVIGAIPEGEIFPCMNVDPSPLFTTLSENIKPVATNHVVLHRRPRIYEEIVCMLFLRQFRHGGPKH